jgi:hypothetical protein
VYSDGGAASGGAAPGAGLEGAFAGKESLDPFFIPDGIAVVGVSATANAKAGNEIVKNLLELGRDDVYGSTRGGAPRRSAADRLPSSSRSRLFLRPSTWR